MKKALSFIVIVAFVCTMLPMQTMAQMRPSSSRLFRSLSRVGEVLGESASGIYKTTATVNVRSNPSVGITSKVVGQQSAGVMATVVPNSATVVANGYSWINLDFVTGVDGWVAADNLILVAATPATPVTYTSADIDLFIKSIPQKITALQEIQNNPDAFKEKYQSGMVNMNHALISPDGSKKALQDNTVMCLTNIFGQGVGFVWSSYYQVWKYSNITYPNGCPSTVPSSGTLPFIIGV